MGLFFGRRKKQEVPIVHAGDDDFDEAVAGPGVTLVDFWAPWCAPCRMMEPILDEIAVEQEAKGVTVLKVNVDEAPDTAQRFEIGSIPTLIFFRDGEPLFQMAGLVPKPVLERELGELTA